MVDGILKKSLLQHYYHSDANLQPIVDSVYPNISCLYPNISCLYPNISCLYPNISCLDPNITQSCTSSRTTEFGPIDTSHYS